MSHKQRSSRKSTFIKPVEADVETRSDNSTGQVKKGLAINWQRIGLRMAMIGGIMILVYFSKENQVVTFASQKEEITNRSVVITCSQDYTRELKQFPGCVPNDCGRVILDSIVSHSEVMALLDIARRGLSLGGSLGGASILDLHSGALSYGNTFVNIYKMDQAKKIFTNQDFLVYRIVKNKIHQAVSSHFGIAKKKLLLTHPTFFSHITNLPAKTIHDEYWHAHVDKETYGSFHYTSLLYLNDFGRDFEGGRFMFVDKDSNKTVEPRSGRISAFTSGSENYHFVEKVTLGSRFAITVSFTCDPEHAIEDPKMI